MERPNHSLVKRFNSRTVFAAILGLGILYFAQRFILFPQGPGRGISTGVSWRNHLNLEGYFTICPHVVWKIENINVVHISTARMKEIQVVTRPDLAAGVSYRPFGCKRFSRIELRIIDRSLCNHLTVRPGALCHERFGSGRKSGKNKNESLRGRGRFCRSRGGRWN